MYIQSYGSNISLGKLMFLWVSLGLLMSALIMRLIESTRRSVHLTCRSPGRHESSQVLHESRICPPPLPTVWFWVCLNAAVVYRVLWDETYSSIFKSPLTVLVFGNPSSLYLACHWYTYNHAILGVWYHPVFDWHTNLICGKRSLLHVHPSWTSHCMECFVLT